MNACFQKICILVLSCHLLVFVYILRSPPMHKQIKKDPLVIKTFHAQIAAPPQRATVKPSIQKAPTTAKAPIKKKPNPLPKKTPPSTPTPKPTVKNKTSTLEKSLKEIKESIAKIEEEHAKMKDNPKWAATEKHIFTEDTTEQATYPASLAIYLKSAIQLPDVGEVKIKLTLYPNGHVKEVHILSAESQANRKRIESILPTLCFPIPPNKQEQTFILTLCHEL